MEPSEYWLLAIRSGELMRLKNERWAGPSPAGRLVLAGEHAHGRVVLVGAWPISREEYDQLEFLD
jgi:hypothetical protein